MGMDFKEFEKFTGDFKKIQKDHEQFIRKFLLKMAENARDSTKRLTPVDTGKLRGAWELGKVYRDGDYLKIILRNPTDYASDVEEGHFQEARPLRIDYLDKTVKGRRLANELRAKHSEDIEMIMLKEKWIKGFHMARISIAKIDRAIPNAYKKALKEFMQGLGGG